MSRLHTFPNRGFVVEAEPLADGLEEQLIDAGLARTAVATTRGLVVEPRISLHDVLRGIEASGARVHSVHASVANPGWHHTVRPAAKSRLRLTNPLSPGWLPTFPAA